MIMYKLCGDFILRFDAKKVFSFVLIRWNQRSNEANRRKL